MQEEKCSWLYSFSLKQALFITYTICQEYDTYFSLNTWLLAFVSIMKHTHTRSERILTVEWTSLFQRDVEIYCRTVGSAVWCLSCGHHCSWQREFVGADIIHLEFCLAHVFIISTQQITRWSWSTTRSAYMDLLLVSAGYFQSSSSSRNKSRKTFDAVS